MSPLPPLIPLRDFFANKHAQWGHMPSHDGSLLARYAVRKGRVVVQIVRSSDSSHIATLKDSPVTNFIWHPYKSRVLLQSRNNLFEIDPSHPKIANWIDISPRGLKNWRLESFPDNPDSRIVVASNDRNPAAMDLYTVRQDGGELELLEQNSDITIGWLLDNDGLPKMRIDRTGNGGAQYFVRSTTDWRLLVQTEPGEFFEPLKLSQKHNMPLVALSNRGRNKIALVDVDLETGQETVSVEHHKVDVSNVVRLDHESDRPDLLIFHDGYPSIHPLTELGKTFTKLLLEEYEHVDFQILGVAADRPIVTVAKSVDQRPNEYFLIDLDAKTSTKVGQSALQNHADQMSETKPVKFYSRDGLEIAGYLTIPKGCKPANLPTILKIHGGPAQRDRWIFDPEIQFLSNRGYAVMSVNYRGSIGYGKTYQNAGHGEVGRAMQNDVIDAGNWLISERIADPDRMAIMGSSFGGYIATLAMTREPRLFKAAIAENPVTDIPFQMENNPAGWGLHLDGIKQYFGDPHNVNDLRVMEAHSPLNHAPNANGVFLMIVGNKDDIVNPEQSKRFIDALKKNRKGVQTAIFRKEGHVFAKWQSRYLRGRIIELFLKKHLRGRSSKYELMNLIARIFS